MVEKEVDKMVQNLQQRLQYQGLTLEQYFQFTGTDEDKMREYMRANAQTKVKVDLVLEAIEKAEKEFEIYRKREMDMLESDFDKEVKRLNKK